MKSYSDVQERSTHRPNKVIGFFKAVISIVVLTSLVLAIVFSVRYISDFNSASMSNLLNKVGLGDSKVGRVAGDFIERVSDNSIEDGHKLNILPNSYPNKDENIPNTNVIEEDIASNKTSRGESNNQASLVLKIALLSDSHLSTSEQNYKVNESTLTSAFDVVKEMNINTVLLLGDVTNYGDLPSLKLAKQLLQNSNLNYKVLPGDHDLAASVGLANFLEVFSSHNYSFVLDGFKFVMLDNSANFTVIPQDTLDWFAKEVKDADFVLLSQPIYTEGLTLFSNIYMGSTMASPDTQTMLEKQDQVKDQRNLLLSLIRSSNVKAVIAGDHHRSSSTVDKTKVSLSHHVVGAITNQVGDYAQKSLQSQRFSILHVYSDGTYELKDILLDSF